MKRFLSIAMALCLILCACAGLTGCTKPAPKENLNLTKLKEYAANPNYKLEIVQGQVTEKDGPDEEVYRETSLVDGRNYVSEIESYFLEETMHLKTECFEQDNKLIQVNFGNFESYPMSDQIDFLDDMQFISAYYAELSDKETVDSLISYEAPTQLMALISDGVIKEDSEGKLYSGFDTTEIEVTPDSLIVTMIEDYSGNDYTYIYSSVYSFTNFGSTKVEISADAKAHETEGIEYGYYMKKVDIIAEIVGDYVDQVSGRATMNVYSNGGNGEVHIGVSWADSAFETYYWDMNCSVDIDNLKLEYTDCVCAVLKVDKNGEEVLETVYENGKGYFTLYGDVIKWTGAEEPNCQMCEFVFM